LNNGVKMLWMGDLETEFMENIQDDLNLSITTVIIQVFAWAFANNYYIWV